MNTFFDFFSGYIDTKSLPDNINSSVIVNIEIDSARRMMNIYLKCSELLERKDIFEAEKRICKSVLSLSLCFIHPRYESILFDIGYYPQMVAELKRRNASLNGTLNDSSAEVKENKIVIYLQHGGVDILTMQKFDQKLSELIKSEFGIFLEVSFSGVLSIDYESETYIEHQKINEEKALREAKIEAQEQYEMMMKTANERKALPQTPPKEIPVSKMEIEIREGASLIPSYIN